MALTGNITIISIVRLCRLSCMLCSRFWRAQASQNTKTFQYHNIASTVSRKIQIIFMQAFIVMHVVFKILGAQAFQKMSLLHNMASVARKAIYHHFEQITKVLTL